MATWRINNATLLGGEVAAQWQLSHAYSLGARVVCRYVYGTAAARAFVYECTRAGTSGSGEPSWPTTVGNTVDDPDAGGAQWTCRQSNDGSWDNAHPIAWWLMSYHTSIAAGDTFYVHYQHNEYVSLGASTYIVKGSTTANNPIKMFSVDKTDDSLQVGAIIGNASASYAIEIVNYGYAYGITFKTLANLRVGYSASGNTMWVIEGDGSTDTLYCLSTSSTYAITFGGSASYMSCVILLNAVVRINDLDSYMAMTGGYGRVIWLGGKFSSTTGSTALFRTTTTHSNWDIRDVDLEDIGAGATATALVSVSGNEPENAVFTRCKLPSDAGFSVISSTWDSPGKGKVKLHHCSSANKVHDFSEWSYEGNVQDEETIIRTGGASDGVTSISWKMVSSANTKESIIALDSPPITEWADGGMQEITIEGIWDSASQIQDDELWMDIEYPADASSGLGAVSTTRIQPSVTPVNLFDSGAPWVMTGLTNPKKFHLNKTISMGKAGPVTVRLNLAKPSTTIYIDPKIRFTEGAS